MPTTMQKTSDGAKALGAFLERTRSSRAPDGFTSGARRRRVTGLRREEVATAAGISVTWYTWLEQGRPISASRETLGRIASALRMDRTERRHLFDLAHVTRGARLPAPSSTVPAQLRDLVDAMPLTPAYVINGLWDVLHFNAACRAVLGPFERGSGHTGNVLRRLFLDPVWRNGFEEWELTAQSAVGQFRGATGRLLAADDFGEFVSTLADESPAFRAMWERRRLANPPIKHKMFNHPIAGRLTFHYAGMKPDWVADDLLLIVYAPAAESLETVRTLTSKALVAAAPHAHAHATNNNNQLACP